MYQTLDNRENIINNQEVDNLIPNSDNFNKSRTHVIKNNYWNDRHEKILKGLQVNSYKLYKEYQKAHLVYKKKLRLYRIPIIIMSSLSGFLSISNSGYVPASYNKWVSMFVGFVNLMVTVISLIENFKKIDVNMNKTYSTYLEFKKLHDEISLVLNTPQNERDDNGFDMATMFFSRYEMYVNDAPILSKALHDHLDDNSPDNTTQTVSPSASYSKSSDNRSSIINEELYTEFEYDDMADELESQKKIGLKKLDKKSKQVLNNVRQPLQRQNTMFGFLGFGSDNNDNEDENEYNSPKHSLNAVKSSIKNSGRTKSLDEDFDKNVFIKKKQQIQKKSVGVKKASKNIQKNKVENKIQGEINSNINRLEEEMKKLDDLELKPTKLPVLRNIKISEDLDNISSKQDSKDGDFIQIIGDEEEDDSDKE